MATLADLAIARLREAGVRTLFGVPGGGSNLDLVDAGRRGGLPFVLTATETAAALAALAQAEVTGAPGACLTTLGPGAASAVNGVACALLDRAPLVVFTDSHAAAADGCEHQRLDQAALFRPVTKWNARLAAAEADATLACAIRIALAPPAGPVHLDCPGDVAGAAVEDGARATAALPAADATDASALAAILKNASRPLLVAGLGARAPRDAAAIRTFCERHGLPAMVTYKAKGVLPDDDPWFGGVFTHGAIERTILDECDVMVGVGLDPVELLPRPWTWRQPIAYVGHHPADTRQVPFAPQVVGEIADALEAVAPARSTWDRARIRALVEDQRRAVRIDGRDGLSPDRVVERIAARAATARVTVDAGAHMFPATMLWPVREPNGMLISNGLSTMGFAVPAAIGAALLDRERPVVALTGDGGLLMGLGELLTMARERLRIITIVFDDRSLSLIEIKQQARRLPAAGVALGPIDWPKLAESLGVAGFRATSESELDSAVDRALAADGPSLVAARVDAGVYGRMLRAIRG